MTLTEFIREMEDRRKTVTVFAHRPQFGLGKFFGPRHVAIEHERLPSDDSEEFVTVSRGDEFLGSIALSSLVSLDAPAIHEPGSSDIAEADFRYLLELLDDTVFSSFDRRQMLATSREIEDRAVRAGKGTLYAGFQRLSALRDQTETYRAIGRVAGLDVHVYGEPDWDPPALPGVTVHGLLDDEVRDTWFVAYDGGGNALNKCALLAQEHAPGEFYGFWTYDPTLVDRIVDYVEGSFTHVSNGPDPSDAANAPVNGGGCESGGGDGSDNRNGGSVGSDNRSDGGGGSDGSDERSETP